MRHENALFNHRKAVIMLRIFKSQDSSVGVVVDIGWTAGVRVPQDPL
jgi:hypothetical protein